MMGIIAGVSSPIFHSMIEEIELPNWDLVDVDLARAENDERDWVVLGDAEYTACEGENYQIHGFQKFFDAWVFQENERRKAPGPPQEPGGCGG